LVVLTAGVLLASDLATAHRAQAQTTIVPNSANQTAVLGSAYRSEREGLIGQTCVSGTATATGTPTSSFNFTQELSQRDAASELGFGAGGHARFGAVKASTSARFMRGSSSSAYSVGAVWMSDYRLPVEKLTAAQLSPIGLGVAQNDERWAQTCGDEYVAEIVRGGKLFFSIRLDFSSTEAKQSFEARFKISGPLFGVQGDLKTASREFSRETRVTVQALQVGGDVAKLTAIFPTDTAGRAGYVRCTLGAFDQCASFIESAITYATDTQHGFPSQLAANAADLEYRTAPYTSMGVFPKNYPGLTEAIARARGSLHETFEQQFTSQMLAERLLELPLEAPRRQRIAQARDVIAANIAATLAVSEICYGRPSDCPAAVTGLHPRDFDASALTLPPLPTASVRLHTTAQGLLTRPASLALTVPQLVGSTPDLGQISAQLNSLALNRLRTISLGSPIQALCAIATPMPPCGDSTRTVGGAARELSDLRDHPSVGGEASAVLAIEGVGLKQARLFFEDTPLKTIPLTFTAGGFPSKYTPNSALIVLATTRGNPGWLDLDFEAEAKKLMHGVMPKADGVFYALVEDQFGRQVRVDLAYFAWGDAKIPIPDREREMFKITWRHRWWDPATDGTTLTGPSPWSEQGRVEGHVDRPRTP
jgi:hypothetical protein